MTGSVAGFNGLVDFFGGMIEENPMAVVGHELRIHLVAKVLQGRWDFRRAEARNLKIVSGDMGHEGGTS